MAVALKALDCQACGKSKESMDIFYDPVEYLRQKAKKNECSCSNRRVLYEIISTYVIVTHANITVVFVG